MRYVLKVSEWNPDKRSVGDDDFDIIRDVVSEMALSRDMVRDELDIGFDEDDGSVVIDTDRRSSKGAWSDLFVTVISDLFDDVGAP